MSLDWDVSKVKDYKTLCWIDNGDTDREGNKLYDVNPVTKSLTFATMYIGLNEITEDNIEEFAIRLHMWEQAIGALMIKWPQTEKEKLEHGRQPRDRHIKLEELRQHIGLHTNASRLTRAQFHKSLIERIRRAAESLYQTDEYARTHKGEDDES